MLDSNITYYLPPLDIERPGIERDSNTVCSPSRNSAFWGLLNAPDSLKTPDRKQKCETHL